jgi:hypothetical protein
MLAELDGLEEPVDKPSSTQEPTPLPDLPNELDQTERQLNTQQETNVRTQSRGSNFE